MRFALGIGVCHRHALLRCLDIANLHAQLQLQALLGEDLLGFLGHLLIHCGQECGQGFQHSHFGAQTAPHRAHLQPDHARPDHTQLRWHFANGQGTIVGQDQLFIEWHARQLTRIRASGQHHMLTHQGVGLVTRHGDFIAPFGGLHE